jgi:hypothetical protein
MWSASFAAISAVGTLQEDTGAVLQALWALDRTDDVRSLTSKLALRA